MTGQEHADRELAARLQRVEEAAEAAMAARKRQERARKLREAQRQLAKQQQQEKASEKAIQGLSKPCPGRCGWRIQKNEGCNHMTCKTLQFHPSTSYVGYLSRVV